MSSTHRVRLAVLTLGACVLCAGCKSGSGQSWQSASGESQLQPAAGPQDIGWPRVFTRKSEQITLYQPQVDEWKDFSAISFRMAVQISMDHGKKIFYGSMSANGNSFIDHERNLVVITDLQSRVQFPGVSEHEAKKLEKLVHEVVPPRDYLQVSLDRVLACVHGSIKPRVVDVNLNPPPIYHSDVPAILVMFMGPPQFKPIKGTKLLSAVNTNWPVFLDEANGRYYLLDQSTWLTAPDAIKGPWAAATSLPAEFSKLPKEKVWDEARKHIPLVVAKSAPRVFATTEPAELIVTQGPPSYTPISGTSLLYASNPVQPLFMCMTDSNVYFLAAGRWFRAPNLEGPWTAASTSLPSDFARIPASCPVHDVLASVPGTQEAKQAVLLASLPHIATVQRGSATVTVVYEGEPKFVPIQGTMMTYAVNTSYQIIGADGQYYCCYNGIWFVAPTATGPWVVAATIPQVIYTIPPTNPMYNVTYVQVYSSTPSTVVVGYTGGYSGEYVAATGALMFGAGMATGALLASCDHYYYPCYPSYCSYGCAACYHYGYGGYYRGCSCYGPYGGCGHYAGYNPATGAFSRGAYHYGPYGAGEVHQAYNPWTNTYRAHASGTNGYQSWGRSVATNGDQWAESSHVSGRYGSAGQVHTSSGWNAEGVHTAGGTTAVKTPNNVYAAHDGNVYRKPDDGGWQHWNNGGWQDAHHYSGWNNSFAQSMDHDFASRGWGDSMSNRWGGGGFGGDRFGGFGRGGFGGGGFHGGGFRR